MAAHRRRRVDIDRGADLAGDFRQRHVLAMELGVFELKMIHAGPNAQLPFALQALAAKEQPMARPKSSVVANEIAQFASHAGDWWDPNGSEAMLHKLNPVRLKYVRDMIDQHWRCDEHVRRPLEGRT